MSNVAKKWGTTNMYRMNELFSLVFIHHEPDLGRIVCILVLYDINQKIPYNTAYYCMVLVVRALVSTWYARRRKDPLGPTDFQGH